MNAGKLMERQWRNSAIKIPGLRYQRMNDGTASFWKGQDGARFQQKNPFDCYMFKKPILFELELKSHKGKNIPFSAIRNNQINHLAKISKEDIGVVAGIVVYFEDEQKCYYADGDSVLSFMNEGTRKSIPIAWFKTWGTEIKVIPLRRNVMYDVNAFVNEMLEREEQKDSERQIQDVSGLPGQEPEMQERV